MRRCKIQYYPSFIWLILSLIWLVTIVTSTNGEYLIGVGSYDMTGPAAGVNMMGYADIEQTTAGVHFRLRARTFIVAESSQGSRFAFVNLDSGMASQLVTIKVLEKLQSRYGSLYTEENVAISGIHTHAGPGGYLQYVVYSVTSFGFVQQSFDSIVNAIEQSLVQAHENLKPGSVFINKGDVANAGINRSPSAYLLNPEEERAQYQNNVDTLMTILKFVDSASGKSLGGFSWFATHGTSMSKNNRLISGDNKGAAARFFEDWFASTSTSPPANPSTSPDIGELIKKAQTIKATGGKLCGKTTSQGFKVRKNDGSLFVGAFCQSNVGDVTPNVLGAFCSDTGKPCDFNHSSCNGDNQICLGRGPGYPDEILSTKIIGERQFQKAVDLFMSATEQLTGKINYRHVYLNFTNIEVELDENNVVQTCPAALGPGFAAGTTDGPGFPGFQQGDKQISERWIKLRDALKKPSQFQVDCQQPKPVLLDTGEMFDPYAWAPAILPIQILRLGKLIILSVPGEFTTMAGRRLREAVKETLISSGSDEFDNETHVVIAGLSNTYSQYVATFEEYMQQRYESSSTLYGPHTLSAYLQEFKKLAKAMATGQTVPKGPPPPDLSSVQLRPELGPFGDSPPPGLNFGDMKDDINLPKTGFFKKGERPSATFWSASPSYDLLTEGTFAVVEMLQGERWTPVYDDDDFSLYFKYQLDESGLYSLAKIEWEIPDGATSGAYRLRHFGSARKTKDSQIIYFTGASSAFAVS
ncbi:Neutral/alkaline nonlysosomal ceramidase [Parasponia andersonii]|uniref:Neutral ceramidase n=1 Tax=Parasponia andersonii TaxID=3476 RepID=A0A2P5CHQ5_PARAD|nr:Neutral/alkaline nonlysosomal ceramidase [Parasponia andersonii]